MKIRLERRGDYIDFYQDNQWFYEVKTVPELYPDLEHLREKTWFTQKVAQQLFDLI